MDIVIFDFEVFRYDTLFGAEVIDINGNIELVQLWSEDAIRSFYEEHLRSLWIGHNNDFYDNHILAGILKHQNPYRTSKSIINSKFRGRASLDVLSYDLMCCKFYSLKMTELLVGKKIHTTEVDFDIDRPLNEEEKRQTEAYNKSDLEQTLYNFNELKDVISLRLALINEFKIDKKYLTATEAKLASLALGASQIDNIESMYRKPELPSTLRLKNKDVIDFYLTEGFRNGKSLTVTLCNVEHKLGSGGIHGAEKRYIDEDILYLDVSGYYNLVMINYDLLPRTIPKEGKELYEYMYHQQLALKGVNDTKRWVYKTVLLAVFGASMNKYTDFYDPQTGSLITITGQLFLVDLLEKLEGKVKLIQSNTDGIMVKPLETSNETEVKAIVDEWCTRTGFVIKMKHIKKLFQKDVNNYCYILDNGTTDTKGDAFIGSWAIDEPVKNNFYDAKEPAIVARAAYNFFINGIMPEDTVEQYKNQLRYFQYLCKKCSYDYCTYDTTINGKTTSTRISDLNRAFALKSDNEISIIVKHKDKNGKHSKAKLANMPDTYFIYNDEILSNEAIKAVQNKIDYQFYINRAYYRIGDFLPEDDNEQSN